MTSTRRRSALVGLLAAALLAGVLVLATPVFAGSSSSRSRHAGDLTLSISPSRSREPAPPGGGAVFATPLRLGSGRSTRSGSTGTLAVVLAVPGKPAPARKAPRPAQSPRPAARPTLTTVGLRAIAAKAKHPIFWAGIGTGAYELTGSPHGPTVLRYLAPGSAVGSANRELTVRTYIRGLAPYAAARNAALAGHALIRALTGGGLAIQYVSSPRTAYLVFPGAQYEVQVYDPSPGEALHLASTGKIVRIS